MQKKFFAVAAFALAFAVAFSASAYELGSTTLKRGSTGAAVSQMQMALNACTGSTLSTDGKFGPASEMAVKAFQASQALAADGMVGNMTKAKLNSCGSTTTPSTGALCPNGMTLASNCSAAPSTGSTSLSGGAGDATITATSTDVEDSVKEGESNVKVLGFKVEADGSDINVSNVKIVLSNSDFASSSEKLTNYVDTVSVWMEDTKIGSVEASEFTRESGSPDTYTKTISLSNGIVKEGKDAKFYVAFSAADNIDSDDMTAAWDVDLDTVRYNDATGAILSESPSTPDVTGVSFTDASTDDDLSIKSSTNNPLAATLTVKEDATSNKYLVGVFKLDVDEDSSDVSINEIPVVLTINDSANTASSDDDSAIVDEVTIEIDGTSYSSDNELENINNGDGTVTYYFNVDGDETIDSGDDVEVKIYVKFNDQDGNYGVNTTVVASVTGSAIDAEGSDEMSASGSFTGKIHTLSVNAPSVALVGTPSFALSQAIDGVATGQADVFLAKFTFNVTAGDEDIYLSDDETDIVETQLGNGSIDSVVLDAEDSSLDDNVDDAYLITAGSTEKFTLSYYVRGNNVSDKITITSFDYGFSDGTAADDEVLSAGLTNFQTPTVYLAK